MDPALTFSRVARVMRTMSSWARSWLVVPVRCGSYASRKSARVFSCPPFLRVRSGTASDAILGRPPLPHSSPYPCSEPLHKTPNQTAITVHCAERHRGVSPSFACLKQHALLLGSTGIGQPSRSGGEIDCSARQPRRSLLTSGSGVGIAVGAFVRACSLGRGRSWDRAIGTIGRLGASGQRRCLGTGQAWEPAVRGLTRWSSRWGLESGVDVVSLNKRASRNGSAQRNR